jgi:hypothetical protein
MIMKNIYKHLNKLISMCLIISLTSCLDEDLEFGEIIVPSNISIDYEIKGVNPEDPNSIWYNESETDLEKQFLSKQDYDALSESEKEGYYPVGDGSGLVDFTINADNAITYQVIYNENLDPIVAPSGQASVRFTVTGLNTYDVNIIASGKGGVISSKIIQITVLSTFEDNEALEFLSGGIGSTKSWYVSATEIGHLGVGPAFEGAVGNQDPWWVPHWYQAGPWEKDSPDGRCLYDAELQFSLDAENQLTYQMLTEGSVFFNASLASVAGGSGATDQCYDFDTSGVKDVTLVPVSGNVPQFEDEGITRYNENGLSTQMNFSDEGFMAYYLGSSQYEILELSESKLRVRTFMPSDPILAWYLIFTTEKPVK